MFNIYYHDYDEWLENPPGGFPTIQAAVDFFTTNHPAIDHLPFMIGTAEKIEAVIFQKRVFRFDYQIKD